MRLLGGQGRHRQRRRAPTLMTDPVEEDPQVAAVELRQVIPADYLAAAVGHLRQDGERDLQEDQVHAGQTGAATISTTVTRACSRSEERRVGKECRARWRANEHAREERSSS